ncbi:MAG: hypothetical protein LJD31_02005 [Wolbachia endosymbiont of Menacanthus eurysternus]|nr:hypothetical protein [Wolbachia endosymbiont of Menacanthus eurysternus]
MNTSIWKWRNTAHITKMGIEGTVALASLAAAITTVLIATNIVLYLSLWRLLVQLLILLELQRYLLLPYISLY